MNKIITVFILFGFASTLVRGEGILDQARIRLPMDLRWLALEANQLSKLQSEKAVMIDISINAPLGTTKERMDAGYVFKQGAGSSIDEHLRILEKKLKCDILGLYQIQVVTRRQIRLIDGADIEAIFPHYVTQPGDIIILKPLVL